MKNSEIALTTGILGMLVVSLVLVSGCPSLQPSDSSSSTLPGTATVTPDLPVTVTIGPVSVTASDGPPIQLYGPSSDKLTLIVHSADLYRSLPGWNNKAGTGIAVINVSITNNLATMFRLSRENIIIKTERGGTLEHGGDRMSEGMAAGYLRFPLTINPGEMKNGSVVYIVFTGTRINDMILTDGTDKLITRVDLNKIYNYHGFS